VSISGRHGGVFDECISRGGTSVLVTRVDPLREKPIHGRVLSRTSTQLRVSFQKLFDLEDQPWRLVTSYPKLEMLITIPKVGSLAV
jgi:hypothetical protein